MEGITPATPNKPKSEKEITAAENAQLNLYQRYQILHPEMIN
jgi:hypothetical protein